MKNNQFKSKKVAIIGAGIIGLYLGWKLSEKGHQLTIFEKKDKIGKEACSGLFSERILNFVPESRKLVQNEINSCLIHFPKKTLKVKFSKKLFVIDHVELDCLVAGIAKKSGAEIVLNHAISALPQGFDRIIGCDGANSSVRQKLGLKEPKYRLGIQGFVPEENHSDYVEVWPIKHGFSWKIPRGKETEYGIIGKAEEIKGKLRVEEERAGLVPQGLLIPKHSSVTLCGDASGLTKPWSGGGVIWGLIEAQMLLKTFPDFLKYQRKVKRYFLPKIVFSKTATRLAYFLGFKTPYLLPKSIKIESDFLL